MANPQVKASREEFAEVLSYWLATQMNAEELSETAESLDVKGKPRELFGLDLNNKQDSETLAEELLALNMWLIVYSCEAMFKDIDKRNECLDKFHLIIYQTILKGTGEDFDQWKLAVTLKYADYNEAMKTESTLGPFWQLATVVSKNMADNLNIDAILKHQISVYVSLTLEGLLKLINKYEIE